jgi:hypothetical protein
MSTRARVNKALVIKNAKGVIRAIDEERAELRKQAVEKVAAKRSWGGMLGWYSRPLGAERAEHIVKSWEDNNIASLTRWKIKFEGQRATAKRLLELAEVAAEDTIEVTAEDWRTIA